MEILIHNIYFTRIRSSVKVSTQTSVECTCMYPVLLQLIMNQPLRRCPGPTLITAIWRCRNHFSQWQRSFQWKLSFHWLKIFATASCRSCKAGLWFLASACHQLQCHRMNTSVCCLRRSRKSFYTIRICEIIENANIWFMFCNKYQHTDVWNV